VAPVVITFMVSAGLTRHDHSTIACSHHIYMGVVHRALSATPARWFQ